MWWIVVGVATVGLLCVAYGVFIERRWYRLRRYRLDILPADGLATLSVLHLSDLHFVRHDPSKARFLAGLPHADITVVTGDFLAEAEAVEAAVEGVRPTRGRVASYFVLGSNDLYVPKPINYLRYFRKRGQKRKGAERGPAADLIAKLQTDGWVDLTNVRLDAALNGSSAEVAGLDDPHVHRDDLRIAPRRHPDRFGLAVVHSPDPAPELVALGYDLVVAGHTHGGQVRLPLIGALVNNSLLPRKFSRGLLSLGPGYLHISAGLGTSKYAPFRFWCRPEVTLLELGRKEAAR